MAIDPVQIPALVRALEEGDVAIGSRALPGSHVDYGSPIRTLMARTFNQLVRSVTRVELADTQCGFKAFRAPVARLLFHFGIIDGFAFDVEILSLAGALGLDVVEVPVQWDNGGGTSIRASDPLKMVVDILRWRAGKRRVRPLAVLDPRPSANPHSADCGAVQLSGPDGVALTAVPFEPPGPGFLALPFERLQLMAPIEVADATAVCETPQG
jgi:dolichyl-phosphate beta-glucosyltransferase